MTAIKHFYNTVDFSREEIISMVGVALEMKKGKLNYKFLGKILGLMFFNPSLRTRISFVAAMHKLGGVAIDIPLNKGDSYGLEFEKGAIMNGATIEHVKEAANVLSKYCDCLGIRASNLITSEAGSVNVSSWEEMKKDTVIKSFMEYAQVPVINLESNVYHPCQGLADAVTLKEKLGETKGKKYVLTWVYHPKALPMATVHSQLAAACDLGMKVTVVHPAGWELDKEVVGGNLTFSNDIEEGFRDADVICAKSWGALKYYGDWQAEKEIREKLKHWIVDRQKMQLTNNAYFMHCLPVRRNVEVTDEVLDSKNSIVLDQAENRMWAEMAILLKLLNC